MKKKKIIFLIILVFSIPIVVYAGRGCCSHHGGQDYCDKEVGKWVCEDGTYSPSCTCAKTTNNNSKADFIVGSDGEVYINPNKYPKEEEKKESIVPYLVGAGFIGLGAFIVAGEMK